MRIFAQIDNCNRADFTLYRKKNKKPVAKRTLQVQIATGRTLL